MEKEAVPVQRARLDTETITEQVTVKLAVFGFYLGSSFAPNHIGMPLVSPD